MTGITACLYIDGNDPTEIENWKVGVGVWEMAGADVLGQDQGMGWCPREDPGHRRKHGQITIVTGEKAETRLEAGVSVEVRQNLVTVL